MQTIQVGHQDRANQLLHALQAYYFDIHDALYFIEDALGDVRPDTNHPLEWSAQFESELPEDECVKSHQGRVIFVDETLQFDFETLVLQFFVDSMAVLF